MDGLPAHFGAGGRFRGRGRGGGRGAFRGRPQGGGRHHHYGAGGRGRNFHQNRAFTEADPIEEIGDCSPHGDNLTIAVEGCCHGNLNAIYDRLQRHEKESGKKIHLLLCCGDFQSLRNIADFHSLAVPPKYRALGDFHAYYSGSKQAPILTIFIGGNHEASQPLHELPYGGWVAPNIYYMGRVGVVNFGGVRIGGISGIYKSHDFRKGLYESPPFERDTLRSVYHVRNVDVYRMKCLAAQPPIDIIMSHDWPLGIEQHGDTNKLIQSKPFFRQEIERNDLGSPPNRELLNHLKPRYWFSAHLHVKFHATVTHDNPGSINMSAVSLVPSQTIQSMPGEHTPGGEGEPITQFVAAESTDPCQGPDLTTQMTQFLSLDKCLPRRNYLSIVHIPIDISTENISLEYDVEWLATLLKTHALTKIERADVSLPPAPTPITQNEIEQVRQRVGTSLIIPTDFAPTVPPHLGPVSPVPHRLPPPLPRQGNPQTDQFLQMLGLEHITTIPFQPQADLVVGAMIADENEINIDDDAEISLGDDSSENTNGDDGRITAGVKRPKVESSEK